jgi:phage/plasmid-associated DNA primase
LKHFFLNIEIAEDKYFLNITSNLCDKISDINNSLKYIKEQIKIEHNLTLISFVNVYSYYQSYCASNSIKFVVSKRYFEKYLYYKFVDYIVYEKFIKIEWTNT